MRSTPSIKHLFATLAVVSFSSLVSAAPEVTSVSFHDASNKPVSVATDHYVAVGTFEMALGSTMTTTYVMNGQSASTANPADAPDYGGMYVYTNAPTPMLGFNGRWATALVQLHYSPDIALSAAALSGLPTNLVNNTNTDMFSGGSGPVNKTNLSLAEAGIPAGTGVTMTIDMNGETPHMVGVYSGSAPSG